MEIQQISESKIKGNFKRRIQGSPTLNFHCIGWLSNIHLSISIKLPSLAAVFWFLVVFFFSLRYAPLSQNRNYFVPAVSNLHHMYGKVKHTLKPTFAFKLSSSSPISWSFYKLDQEIANLFLWKLLLLYYRKTKASILYEHTLDYDQISSYSGKIT